MAPGRCATATPGRARRRAGPRWAWGYGSYIDLLPGVAYETTVTGPAEQVERMAFTSLNDWLLRVRAGAAPG